MTVYFHSVDQEQLRIVLFELYALGYKYHGNVESYTEAFDSYKEYPVIRLVTEKKYIDGYSRISKQPEAKNFESVSELFVCLESLPI
jgi:hypothetical protein